MPKKPIYCHQIVLSLMHKLTKNTKSYVMCISGVHPCLSNADVNLGSFASCMPIFLTESMFVVEKFIILQILLHKIDFYTKIYVIWSLR